MPDSHIFTTDFKFPAILSALRAKSTKPKREPKKGMLPRITIIPTTRLSPKLKASSISTVTSTISKQTTLVLDSSSCHFPSLSLPPTSTSSVSSYSSTYTIVESSLPDLPTPTDEDTPISFNRSLPSWRRDPDRAKFVFGSLARSIIDVTSDGRSQAGVTNNGKGHLHSIEKSKAEGERTGNMMAPLHEAAISEKCSTLKDQRLESIIIAMGLNPLLSATTFHSDIGIFEDIGKELGKKQLSKDHEITHTGSMAWMDTVKSRESVVSDLLTWVESSSSSSSQ